MQQAMDWYARAAERNHVEAQWRLGVLCWGETAKTTDEHEIKILLEKTVKWLERAAAQNSTIAHYYLGDFYLQKVDTVPAHDHGNQNSLCKLRQNSSTKMFSMLPCFLLLKRMSESPLAKTQANL